MTTSPVVGPDREGGRAVEVNIDHKFWCADLHHAACSKRRNCLDRRPNAISSVDRLVVMATHPAQSRFVSHVTQTLWLTLRRDLLYDAI